jgi:EAL and modified HD-GYP domain-containing signal transduction protein
LETVEPDPEVLQVCRKLKLKGYRFALDDFSPADSKLQFLELADFIKIDFLTSPQVVRDKIYALVSNSSVRLLAEKVETEADVQLARSEGCELFQGYFFSKPAIVTNRIIPQNHAVYLQLLAALSRTPAEIDEIEKLVVSDASLCYRLLRLVNSAMYALPSTVSTIRSALLMVGDDEFRKLVTVAFTGLATAAHSKVLMHMAIERAKFCEMMAPSLHESGSRLYLLGMLSVVDTILRIPMKQLVTLLPLDREMKAALLGEGSSLAVALDCVRCHESGDWQRLASIRQSLGISDNKASTIYLNALQWADMTTHAML